MNEPGRRDRCGDLTHRGVGVLLVLASFDVHCCQYATSLRTLNCLSPDDIGVAQRNVS